jgi:hypothetical protein
MRQYLIGHPQGAEEIRLEELVRLADARFFISSSPPITQMLALFTRASIRPAFSRISVTPRSTDSSSRTSSSTCSKAGVSGVSERSRTVPNTLWPDRERSMAVAKPILEKRSMIR